MHKQANALTRKCLYGSHKVCRWHRPCLKIDCKTIVGTSTLPNHILGEFRSASCQEMKREPHIIIQDVDNRAILSQKLFNNVGRYGVPVKIYHRKVKRREPLIILCSDSILSIFCEDENNILACAVGTGIMKRLASATWWGM